MWMVKLVKYAIKNRFKKYIVWVCVPDKLKLIIIVVVSKVKLVKSAKPVAGKKSW